MSLESQLEHYEVSSYQVKGKTINLFKQVSKAGLEKYKAKREWQKRVYKHGIENNDGLIEYHKICQLVFKRDSFKCESCFKTRYKLSIDKKFLTAHHIIPREDGGTNDMDNLLTLCNVCHDGIEDLKLRTKQEISGYYSQDRRHWSREENIGTTWQQWVYGGRRKPRG